MHYSLSVSIVQNLISTTEQFGGKSDSNFRIYISAALLLVSIFNSSIIFAQTKKEISSRGIHTVTVNTFDARKKDTTGRKNFSRFDKRGNLVEAIEYDLNGKIKSWEQLEYNQQDDETIYRELLPDGKISKTTHTRYNKWHKISDKTTMDSLGLLLEKTSYSYSNSNDLITELTSDKEGKITHQVLYKYDNKGMLLSRKILNEKGQMIYSKEYTYQY